MLAWVSRASQAWLSQGREDQLRRCRCASSPEALEVDEAPGVERHGEPVDGAGAQLHALGGRDADAEPRQLEVFDGDARRPRDLHAAEPECGAVVCGERVGDEPGHRGRVRQVDTEPAVFAAREERAAEPLDASAPSKGSRAG